VAGKAALHDNDNDGQGRGNHEDRREALCFHILAWFIWLSVFILSCDLAFLEPSLRGSSGFDRLPNAANGRYSMYYAQFQLAENDDATAVRVVKSRGGATRWVNSIWF
jgi:hypothetical protein